MFLKRSNQLEIMDDFSVKDERIDRALKELKIINRFLGGNSTSKKGIKELLNNSDNSVKVLDAGSGASDVFLTYQKKNLNIFTIDKNLRACKYLKKNSHGINIICGDILKPPFKKNCFDIIHASLFLHHFNETELKEILNVFTNICKRGIIINDLRRNIIALAGIKILSFLFSRSEMIKNDAPLSVKRSFIKSDLIRILSCMNFANFLIKRKWAFRWLVVILF